MPTECSAKPMGFARVDGRAVVADFEGGAITSNAGGLLLGATDRAIGLVERFAACFADSRTPERVVHEVATLVGQRVFGIALGYEDLVDHDRLRHDPVLGVVLGRLEARHGRCAPLAGKSTLNRLEHGAAEADRYRRIAHDGAAIEALFVDLFLTRTRRRRRRSCSISTPPTTRCTATRRRFFHGYYDCYCYRVGGRCRQEAGEELRLAARARAANAGEIGEGIELPGCGRSPLVGRLELDKSDGRHRKTECADGCAGKQRGPHLSLLDPRSRDAPRSRGSDKRRASPAYHTGGRQATRPGKNRNPAGGAGPGPACGQAEIT